MKLIRTLAARTSRLMAASAITVAATALLVTTPASHGQFGGAQGLADLATRDYMHRDMIIVAQSLDLDDSQRVILDNLFEDYVSEFETGWEGTQKTITDMLEGVQRIDPNEALEKIIKPFEQWREEKQRIKERFESGIRSILNEQQLAQWPAFQRQMTREKSLHEGRLSGENVNLFHIVRDLRLDERTMNNLEPVLDEYSIALHDALQRRHAAMQRAEGDFLQVIRKNQNPASQLAGAKAVVDRRVAVRDVNDRYREQIAARLPHEQAQEFKAAALERGYSRVFRPLPAMRVYRQALELDDLDDDTHAAIYDLWVIFEAEMEVLNARLLSAVRDFEPRQMRNQAELYAARQTGESIERVQDPTREQIRNRDDRAEYYVTQLRELLGEEKFAELPGGRRWIETVDRQAAADQARQRIRERRERMSRDSDGLRRESGRTQRGIESERRTRDAEGLGGRRDTGRDRR